MPRTLYHGTIEEFETFDPSVGEGFGVHFADRPEPCRQVIAERLESNPDPAGTPRVLACEVAVGKPLPVQDQCNWSPFVLARDLVGHDLITADQMAFWDRRAVQGFLATYPSPDDVASILAMQGAPISNVEEDTFEMLSLAWHEAGWWERIEEGDFAPALAMYQQIHDETPFIASLFDHFFVPRDIFERARHAMIDAIQAHGYDAISYRNVYESGYGYVVFDSDRILHARPVEYPNIPNTLTF